jgi:hypothetical protein
MRRIMKLTPATIKRIIAEERQKLESERKKKLFEQLKLLKKIKNRQIKSLSEAKELHEAKMLLIKKIKGKK